MPSLRNCSNYAEQGANPALIKLHWQMVEPRTTAATACQQVTTFARRSFSWLEWTPRNLTAPPPRFDQLSNLDACRDAHRLIQNGNEAIGINGELLVKQGSVYTTLNRLHPKVPWFDDQTTNVTNYLVTPGYISPFSNVECHSNLGPILDCATLDKGYYLTDMSMLVWNYTKLQAIECPYRTGQTYNASRFGRTVLIKKTRSAFTLHDEPAPSCLPTNTYVTDQPGLLVQLIDYKCHHGGTNKWCPNGTEPPVHVSNLKEKFNQPLYRREDLAAYIV